MPRVPRVPIGKPIDNIRIHILDDLGQAVPIGVPGEIHIGGVGVARGYLGQPELTQARFIPDPFAAALADTSAPCELSGPHAQAGRLYKTGDIGWWREDGAIDYLGRADHQVKIRGQRVELGEIEHHLLKHPGVSDAVVVAHTAAAADGTPGEQRLVAYVVLMATAGDERQDLIPSVRATLRATLPAHMVPSALVQLPALPLNANGKLDRKALPAPTDADLAHAAFEAPQGALEEAVAAAWRALLGVETLGRHDNFFDLGGHSLLAIRLSEQLRAMGWQADMRLVFEAPTLARFAQALTERGQQKSESTQVWPASSIPPGCTRITPDMLPLIELSQGAIDHIVAAVGGDASRIQDIYPLAPLQEGMLFHHASLARDQNGRPLRGDPYVMPMLLRLEGPAQQQALLAALQRILARHDALRTAVVWQGLPQAVQVVMREVALPVQAVALTPTSDVLAQLQAHMAPQQLHMDLSQAPLLRLELAALPGTQGAWHSAYAIIYLHHLVDDNQSLQVVRDELRALVRDEASALPTAAPYRDFVARTRALSASGRDEPFFQARLADVSEPTSPFGLMDVHGDGSDVVEHVARLPDELSQRIVQQARQHGVVPAALLHLAWGMVVAQASGRDDVVFGTVLSGRVHGQGSAHTVGAFINTLPLRMKLAGKAVAQRAAETQAELLALLAHDHAPLALAQRCSAMPAGTPLFTSVLNVRHPQAQGILEADAELAPGMVVLSAQERSNYPLVMSVDDLGGDFVLRAQASAHASTGRDELAARCNRWMTQALDVLTRALERTPQAPMNTLSALPAEESTQVLGVFNNCQAPAPRQILVHQLVEAQARLRPDAPAISMGAQQLSYAELNQQANQWAHLLQQQGLGRGDLIGLCMPRSPALLIGLLAILKVGAAYVPLDPVYPRQRLAHMVADSRMRLIITAQGLHTEAWSGEVPVLDMDASRALWSGLPHGDLDTLALSGEDPAYAIYTSGSTGTPKGVLVSHANLANLATVQQTDLEAAAHSRVLQFASISFDASIWECLLAWGPGACLVMAERETLLPGQALYDTLRDERITHALLPPVAVSMMPTHEGLSALRVLCVGG